MKRILSIILCLSLLVSTGLCGFAVNADDVVEEPAWTEVVPTEITDALWIGAMKGAEWTGYAGDGAKELHNLKISLDKSIPQPLAYRVPDAYNGSWGGKIIFSSTNGALTGPIADKEAEIITFPYINTAVGAGNSVMFYVELPDYEKSGATWGLAFNGLSLVQNETTIWTNIDSAENPTFDYIAVDGKGWEKGTIANRDSEAKTLAEMSLPSGFKGYVRLNLDELTYWNAVDFSKSYNLGSIAFVMNSIGGDCGNLSFGGIFYFPSKDNNSTYIAYANNYFKLNELAGKNMTVYSRNAYNVSNSSMSTYPNGNTVTAMSKLNTGSGAVWEQDGVLIVHRSKQPGTTANYMNMYAYQWPHVEMQPGVDTFMFYVEVPVHSESTCALKMCYPMIQDSEEHQYWINPSQGIYEYMSVTDGVWKTGVMGMDGEMNDIPSGFKGYIKCDIKTFTGYLHTAGTSIPLDLSKPYKIQSFQLAFNHVGGSTDNNPLIIGALYSVYEDSDTYMFTNSVAGTVVCAKEIKGDLDFNGVLGAGDLVTGRHIILGYASFDTLKQLRGSLNTASDDFDVRDLVALKKLMANTIE